MNTRTDEQANVVIKRRPRYPFSRCVLCRKAPSVSGGAAMSDDIEAELQVRDYIGDTHWDLCGEAPDGIDANSGGRERSGLCVLRGADRRNRRTQKVISGRSEEKGMNTSRRMVEGNVQRVTRYAQTLCLPRRCMQTDAYVEMGKPTVRIFVAPIDGYPESPS